jgi:hypothetical protein
MLGGVGGGLLGGLLGGGMDDDGGVLQATGSVSIVADNRLNALIVQANAIDLSLVEQLLQVIDQESSPEDVQTSGKPRIIPVRYVPVEEVATVVRQVYASRLQTSGGGGGGGDARQRQPDPAEFIRALRGGGGGRGGQRQAGGEEQKMTLGVDARTNSLIVAAPEPLFLEVQALVELIDIEDATNSEDVQVVTVPGANPEAVKAALSAVLGQPAPSPGASTSSSNQAGRTPDAGGGRPSGDASPEQIQQRIEFFRRLRESGGFGGGSRGGGGPTRSFGGGRGGPPGGGFGGGGRRGGR